MNVLVFLKGVFKENYGSATYEKPNDIIDLNELDSSTDSDETIETINLIDLPINIQDNLYNPDKIKYEKIPLQFYGKDTWLTKTNILCWNCYSKCPGIPLFIPITLTKQMTSTTPPKEVEAIEVRGICCTLPCVRACIESNKFGVMNKDDSLYLAKYVYKILYGKNIKHIPNACNPYIKKCFIGDKGITEKKYIERNNKLLETSIENFV